SNQTLYTTHSPFLAGPDELGLVRVVELTDRKKGTIVHTQVTAEDPGALLPLQEALSHDLAQSLFAQPRNLVVEGLTDLFYLEATADLLRAEYIARLVARGLCSLITGAVGVQEGGDLQLARVQNGRVIDHHCGARRRYQGNVAVKVCNVFRA